MESYPTACSITDLDGDMLMEHMVFRFCSLTRDISKELSGSIHTLPCVVYSHNVVFK